MANVRPPAAAGKFYPADPADLSREVEALLKAAPKAPFEGEPLGLLVPHAGYPYSGPVAARAYKALEGVRFDTVVALGASHFESSPALSVDPCTAYRTPLGEVSVDLDLVEALRALPGTRVSRKAHAEEHSIEVQLPFLQKAFPSAKLVPVVTNAADADAAREIGRALAKAMKGRKALLLISSDFSHFPSGEDARRVDPACLEACSSLDPEYFLQSCRAVEGLRIRNLQCACCGAGAVAAGLAALSELGADRFQALDCRSSADTAGEPGRVVGYGAALFTRTGKPRAEALFSLSAADKARLLALARSALEAYLKTRRAPRTAVFDEPLLNLPCGVFVTWWLRSPGGRRALRGCVGAPHPEKTLGNAAAHYAVVAAAEDTRFDPIGAGELDRLVCEVSALSPMRRGTLEDVRHGAGVMLVAGGRRGLFLPEVWESLPEKERFLGELCAQKLGLPRDAWKGPGLEFYTFRTQSFEED